MGVEPEWWEELPGDPLADTYEISTWNEPGTCRCGAIMPPASEWVDAGRYWGNWTCSACSTLYVDEEEFIAVYPRWGLREEHP